MRAFLMVTAVPLAHSARRLTWTNRGLQCAVGDVTIAIGVTTVAESMVAQVPRLDRH
jgi:hypothetical protein